MTKSQNVYNKINVCGYVIRHKTLVKNCSCSATTNARLSLVTEQLTICTCAAMTKHAQIVSCYIVINDNHACILVVIV